MVTLLFSFGIELKFVVAGVAFGEGDRAFPSLVCPQPVGGFFLYFFLKHSRKTCGDSTRLF